MRSPSPGSRPTRSCSTALGSWSASPRSCGSGGCPPRAPRRRPPRSRSRGRPRCQLQRGSTRPSRSSSTGAGRSSATKTSPASTGTTATARSIGHRTAPSSSRWRAPSGRSTGRRTCSPTSTASPGRGARGSSGRAAETEAQTTVLGGATTAMVADHGRWVEGFEVTMRGLRSESSSPPAPRSPPRTFRSCPRTRTGPRRSWASHSPRARRTGLRPICPTRPHSSSERRDDLRYPQALQRYTSLWLPREPIPPAYPPRSSPARPLVGVTVPLRAEPGRDSNVITYGGDLPGVGPVRAGGGARGADHPGHPRQLPGRRGDRALPARELRVRPGRR